MPLVRALRPWLNRDHEGWVDPGQEFETSEYRAMELVTAGMAVYAISSTEKVKVTADPPEAPSPMEEPARPLASEPPEPPPKPAQSLHPQDRQDARAVRPAARAGALGIR